MRIYVRYYFHLRLRVTEIQLAAKEIKKKATGNRRISQKQKNDDITLSTFLISVFLKGEKKTQIGKSKITKCFYTRRRAYSFFLSTLPRKSL